MNITPIGIRGPGRTSAPAQIRGNGQSSASRYVINGLLPITAEALKSKTVREHHINILVANYGKLPDNHITINYLTDLAKKRVPSFDKKIIVLPNHPEANAFVTLDKGTIFVTQKLINKLGCVQALSFILGHENLHLVEDHAANGSGVGERRVQETRADFLGTKDIHDMGENPLGAIEAMDSLDPKHEASGPIHGASIDRSLNMLMTVPHIDLPNLSHQLDPIPQRIKNSGINPPLAERVCRMSISDIAPMVWSCNFYQLRVMLEAIEEDEIKTLFCENKGVGSQDTVEAKKALLIARARELVCRELIRQKIDQSYADVVLAFYLESIGVEAEIKPDYSKEELTWLSENFIKFAKRSSIGLEPLAKDSARSYCESFATLFSYVVSDNVEDYISLNIKATESVRDVLGSDSPKFLLNPAVSELFAQNLLGDLKREFIKRGRPIRDAKKVIIFDAGEEFLFNPQYDFNLVLPLLMKSNCFDISFDLLGRFMVFVNKSGPGMRSLFLEFSYSYYLSKEVEEFDAIKLGDKRKEGMSDERIRELDIEIDQRVRKTPYLSFYINSFFP
ncbi:MAG: M48 family metalloprotease, partial [Candidatus Saganbacteria bacterium]|nr:M48 family metalloprotease [Candidatus Saganbacteria bacterium]